MQIYARTRAGGAPRRPRAGSRRATRGAQLQLIDESGDAARRPRYGSAQPASRTQAMRLLALALATASGLPSGLPPCRCSNHSKLLLTSLGGVGSSHALTILKETNSATDGDGLKHKSSTYWARRRCARNGAVMLTTRGGTRRRRRGQVCFDEVVVIYGDPLHALESTTRRFLCGNYFVKNYRVRPTHQSGSFPHRPIPW